MKENKNHIHGGNIYKASQQYGIDVSNILDYSANINPLGIPQVLKDILIARIDNLVSYPDTECSELVSEISKYLNVANENIIAGNGASEIIFLLFEVLQPKRVLMPAPTFAEYAKAAGKFGAGIEYFKLKEQNGFRLDVDEFGDYITDGIDCIFLCNPNNPTSTLADKQDLLRLIGYAHRKEVFVIIDEAFIELTVDGNDNSMVEFLNMYDNLFIIRAFTKVVSIPGLRLGYGVGNSRIVKKMWDSKLPWSVNSLACSSGKILSCGAKYLKKTCEWLAEEKEHLYEELKKHSCLKVFVPQTNFILVKILDDSLTSIELRDMMASRGILIRDASNYMFLDNKYFRVAIKDRKSNRKLLKVLEEVLRSCCDDTV